MKAWTTPVLVTLSHNDKWYVHVYAHPDDPLGNILTNEYVFIGTLNRNQLSKFVTNDLLIITYENSVYRTSATVFGSPKFLYSDREYRPVDDEAFLNHLYGIARNNALEELRRR